VYELAFNLRKDLSDVYNMSYEEFLGWQNYFERRPLDWREDERVYKLLCAQGVKAKPQDVFPSLNAVYNQPKDDKFNIDSFKRSAFYQKIALARGGEKVL
jgi:hypothetical protein